MKSPFDHHDVPMPIGYIEYKYGISLTTLWRYRRAGLTAIKVGAKVFIRESDLVAFLERLNGQTVPSTPTAVAAMTGPTQELNSIKPQRGEDGHDA